MVPDRFRNILALSAGVAVMLLIFMAAYLYFTGETAPSGQQDVLDRVNGTQTATGSFNCSAPDRFDVVHVLRTDRTVHDLAEATTLLRDACINNVQTTAGDCTGILADRVVTFSSGTELIKQGYENTTYAYPFSTRNDTLAATAGGDVYLIPQCGR